MSRIALATLVIVLPSAVALARGKPKAAKRGKIASCNYIKSESLCMEWGSKNLAAVGEKSLKDTCVQSHAGDFKLEACPQAKRVGTCATAEGTKVFYSEGPLPLSADDGAKQCKEGEPSGDWKPAK
ncbi:MAG: hypothetical protein ACYDCL_05115 [Myxococcales bacterium]